MIRQTKHSLKFITDKKKNKLDDLFIEYQRVVNEFIKIFWHSDKIPMQINSSIYKQVNSWMMGKAMKCAGNQASKIVRSAWKINSKLTYKKYKHVFNLCKKKDKNINGILDYKWSEWSKGKYFKKRNTLPFFNGNTIELNSDLVSIQNSKKSSEFDLWVRIGSVFGNRFSLILPTKKHYNFNILIEEGFQLKKSLAIRRTTDKYYISLFLEKTEEVKPVIKNKKLGIDLGINKLLSLSSGEFLGVDIKRLLFKLNKKTQKSKSYNRCLNEIKHYIGECVNKIPFEKIDLIVMEDLKGITKNTKGRTNKKLRKQLGHWNLELVYERIQNKCELNRVWFAKVLSEYTSQGCSICHLIDKRSRKQEKYECVHCGNIMDADTNASINILQRYLGQVLTVPDSTKEIISI